MGGVTGVGAQALVLAVLEGMQWVVQLVPEALELVLEVPDRMA